MSRLSARILSLVLGSVASSVLLGQDAWSEESTHYEAGHFIVETIEPAEYPGGVQNWAILQDHRSILYVANNRGVMVYDGEHWELITMPNESGARSLALTAEGRVIVGAQDEFGYLEADSGGALQFVSLVPHLDEVHRGFGDVRSAVVARDGVYFQSQDALFRWSGEDVLDVWQAPEQFGNVFALQDAVYIHDFGNGLMTIEDDTLRVIPAGDFFVERRIQAITPSSDGSWIIGTYEGGLYRYAQDSIEPFETEMEGYVCEHGVYRIAELSSGYLLIGTLRGGALLVEPSGKLVRKVGREDGLPGVTVLSIYEDDRAGVWLGFNAGLARIDLPFAFSMYDYRLGLEGVSVAITRHAGRLYVASTSGVYVLDQAGPGQVARFHLVEGTQEQCFDVLSTSNGLLATCSSGILSIEDAGLEVVREGVVGYSLHQSEVHPGLVYVGLLDGVGLVRYQDGRWEKDGRIGGIHEPIRSIVEDSSGDLWLGTDYQGVLHVTFSGGTGSDSTVRRFGAEDGLPGGGIGVNKVGQDIVLSTSNGYSRVVKSPYASSASIYQIDDHSALNRLLMEVEVRAISVDETADSTLWLFTENGDGKGNMVVRARRVDAETYERTQTPLQRLSGTEMYAQHVDDDDVVWISTQNGLLRFHEAVEGAYLSDFSTLIRTVRVLGTDSFLYGGASRMDATSAVLSHENNALRFTYAAPVFSRGAPTQYRVWLEGFDEGWSPWMEESRRDYTNLPGGEYTFHVQAQNAYGQVSDKASFSFMVLMPWYASWWAVTLFVLLMLGLFASIGYGMYLYRGRQLKKRTRVLEQRVAERTHALRQRTRTLERANLELRAANEQKSEFLGVAAHDLKNPLSGIIEMSSIILDDTPRLDPGALRKLVQEFLPMIHDSATRMLQIIEDLLQAHVLEEEHNELYLERVNMSKLVYSVLRWNRAQAANKRITLYFKPPGRCEAMVDETQMQRVLDNLVSNAIKFSPVGASVQVSIQLRGDCLRISVADEGPGLTESDKKKVFGKLQLLSAKPTAGENSSGLGLFIVKEIVEKHDGHVFVESTPGEGAIFVVELPTRGEQKVDVEQVVT